MIDYLNDEIITEEMEAIAADYVEPKVLSPDWDWQGISERLQSIIGSTPEWGDADRQDLDHDRFLDKLMQIARTAYREQEEKIGEDGMRYLERVIFLQMVDTYWKEHLRRFVP